MNFRMALAAVLVLGSGYPLAADQIRYDSVRDWRQWEDLPLGAVELTPSGLIQPTRIEKGTDAVRWRHPQRGFQPQYRSFGH